VFLCVFRSTKQLVDFTLETIREQGASLYTPQFVAEMVAGPRDWINKRIPPMLTNHMQSADHAKASATVVLPTYISSVFAMCMCDDLYEYLCD
jgi:hypothetical protein